MIFASVILYWESVMMKLERKTFNILYRNSWCILIVFSTIMSLIVRFSMIDYISGDMNQYLIPWFESISSRGGVTALGTPVGDYNIAYQTLIALLSYIPLAPSVLYKFSSSLFDFLSAYTVYNVIIHITGNRKLATIGYSLAVILPSVVMNSALWGQCDSIYVSFCLLGLYFLLKKKYNRCFIAIGIAFAFKLQTVFLLPLFLFLYVKEQEFSIIKFAWIPIMMVVLSLGGILQGLPVEEVFKIYYRQTKSGSFMSMNYPSFWTIMVPNYSEKYYNEMHIYAMLFPIIVLAIYMVILMDKKEKLGNLDILSIAFLFFFTCIYFLPNMHERYGYFLIILGLILSLLDHRMIPMYILMTVIDMITYANYFFGMKPDWQILSIINLLCYSCSTYLIIKKLTRYKIDFLE